MRPLNEKVALVTGAGRGIGRAIALGLSAAGASVACVARTRTEIEGVCGEVVARAGRALAAPADVTDYSSMVAAVSATVDRFGGLDLLIVNAGTSADPRPIEDSDPAAWRRTIEVNLVGAYHTIHAAVPHLRRRGRGNIVVMGSGMGHRATPGSSAYSCSKAGTWMLVRALAEELRGDDILVNELVPGPVATALGRTGGASITAIAPTEWVKQPDDVVPLVLFLATLPPRGPTGQTFSLARREL